MLQSVVEKLMGNQSLLQQWKEGQVQFDGLTKTEELALADVFSENTGEVMKMSFWK
ncbi:MULTISPECIES: competence pheromone ComX [Pontibacillus]|uniref:ComX pheromone n=1 Tax=Pontibacillus chungwhensis TaxID=265426 RepID=A0ABY8V0C9_9BACI|nr:MULTISPECIES: competence pheromone ComX [Pontibacillus]MCD5324313.1 competence pheromone ComX [Pontibacillus sp. HN14]WIF99390.1 competence pheromone ComX [Pontibacillus chungwhensis]